MSNPKKPGPDGFYRQTAFRRSIDSLYKLAGDAEPKSTEHPLNFNISPADMDLCKQIAFRAIEIAKTLGNHTFDAFSMTADIACCHCNGTPLHLLRFLMSDNADFMHDFAGICTHLNRRTGQIMHGFKPLFGVLKS